MQVTITDVKKDMVTVSGQPTHRHYAETVLLPMLMANAGRNNAAKFETIKVFMRPAFHSRQFLMMPLSTS
jgi:hypothetical protein